MEKVFKVGEYDPGYNSMLGINYDRMEIFQSKGLQAHIMKQKHYKALKHIQDIPDIISFPDYIGVTGTGKGESIIYIKCYSDNIMLIVRLERLKMNLYVATMFDLPDKKLNRLIHSGKIRQAVDKSESLRYPLNVNDNDLDEPEKVPGAPEREPDMVDDSRPPEII
ncbi:MAG: hypothetical protein IJT96_09260 [Lachnospiraceae bacterium]|nr:hypothetical protein [Lachnospiraceae bacterium]